MKQLYFSDELDNILEIINQDSRFIEEIKNSKKIGIKTHFGEKGCVTFISPKIAEQIYLLIKKINPTAEINLIESNVLYKGSRTNTEDHIQTAKEHGFDFAPIDICDDKGDLKIKTNKKLKHFREAYFGKSLESYDFIFVISHVKGHSMAGFGGALKNIGMGLASRKGKFALHSNLKPLVDPKLCTACKRCINECPVNAISLVEGRAFIDKKLCIGCAHCIAACNQKAISIPWGSVNSNDIQERIVEYCYILNQTNKKFAFLNILQNITKECDCWGIVQKKEIADLGFIFGKDYCIDQASYDLIEKKHNLFFEKLNSGINLVQFEYAKNLGLSDSNFKLKNLDEKK